MGARTTLRRVLALACVAVTLLPVPIARATQESGTERRGPSMQMPGTLFRKKDKLVRDAVSALSLIMRTENVADPTYVAARRVVSDEVARRVSVSPRALHRAWSKAPRDHQIAVLAALTQLGVPYVEGREDPYVRMDCSGLLWYAWRVAGVDVPRQATSQLDPLMRVPREDAIVGDIVGEKQHVQMYLGVGLAMLHAPFKGKLVKFKIMSEAQAARVAWANPSNIATYRL